jgi:hypothetical protein
MLRLKQIFLSKTLFKIKKAPISQTQDITWGTKNLLGVRKDYFLLKSKLLPNIYNNLEYQGTGASKELTIMIAEGVFNDITRIYSFYQALEKNVNANRRRVLTNLRPLIESYNKTIQGTSSSLEHYQGIALLHFHHVMNKFALHENENDRIQSEEFFKEFLFHNFNKKISNYNPIEKMLIMHFLYLEEFVMLTLNNELPLNFEKYDFIDLINLLYILKDSKRSIVTINFPYKVLVDKISDQDLRYKIHFFHFIITQSFEDDKIIKANLLENIMANYDINLIDHFALEILIYTLIAYREKIAAVSDIFIQKRFAELLKFFNTQESNNAIFIEFIMYYFNKGMLKLKNDEVEIIFEKYRIDLNSLVEASGMSIHSNREIFMKVFIDSMKLFQSHKTVNLKLLDTILDKFQFIRLRVTSDSLNQLKFFLKIISKEQLDTILNKNKPEQFLNNNELYIDLKINYTYFYLILNNNEFDNMKLIDELIAMVTLNKDKIIPNQVFTTFLKAFNHLKRRFRDRLMLFFLDLFEPESIINYSTAMQTEVVGNLILSTDLDIDTHTYNRIMVLIFTILYHSEFPQILAITSLSNRVVITRLTVGKNGIYILLRICREYGKVFKNLETKVLSLIFKLLSTQKFGIVHENLQLLCNYFDNLNSRLPVTETKSFVQCVAYLDVFLNNNIISYRLINSYLAFVEKVSNGFFEDDDLRGNIADKSNDILKNLVERRLINEKIAMKFLIRDTRIIIS